MLGPSLCQIKLTKFYQFLALSWRIYPPVGEAQNNQDNKTLGEPKQKESRNHSG